MKRILLGTSALVGVALFANAASAQVTVRLGGTVNFQAGFLTDDIFDSVTGDTDNDGFDFRNDTEIHVRADGKADNGLLYGVHIELEAQSGSGNSNVGYDEANLYIGGNWGRLELGDQDGATDTLMVFAPVVGIGQIDGDFGEFGAPGTVVKPLDTGDATKVTYYTPRFAGFQAGVSYVPHSGNQGDSVILDDDDLAGGLYRDVIELGANYTTSFGQFNVAVGGGYVFGSGKANPALPGADFDDLESWGVGAQVGWGGITVGGGWVQTELTLEDQEGWNIGAAYENGPWGVALQYHSYETGSNVVTSPSAETQLIAAGATYTLAPGLTVSADLGWFDVEQAGDDDEGWVGILATRVAF